MGRRRGGRGRGRKKAPSTQMKRRMLMNVVDPEEVRVAIVGDRGVEELHVERGGVSFSHGNVYKGKVQNIEPSLQAAFVDIGGEKNGFLHVSDIVPPYGGYDGILKRRRRKKQPEGKRLPIEDMLYKGQELLVQITRESLGHKGPSLTTYVSLPGRYLVLMPAVSKRGVSRKITNENERRELKKSLDELNPPDNMGFIIRTAGMGRGKEELSHDLQYLLRLWEAIQKRTKKVKPPSSIYRESDLVIRGIRDYFYDDVEELLIDGEEECNRAVEFLKAVMPNYVDRASFYSDSDPLFHHYGVEKEIATLMNREVPLRSGGSIVVEQTEAMVTVDVNTGRFRKGDNTRETILAINMEAAEEVARQLKLRDLGGLVMVDFVDMDHASDRRKVEDKMREVMRRDRARVTIMPISPLGVMEMTRQRMRQSLRRALFSPCPSCGGSGYLKSADVLAVEFVRRLRAALQERTGRLKVRMHPTVALSVSNEKRAAIAALEEQTSSRVCIVGDNALAVSDMIFEWLEDELPPENHADG